MQHKPVLLLFCGTCCSCSRACFCLLLFFFLAGKKLKDQYQTAMKLVHHWKDKCLNTKAKLSQWVHLLQTPAG